MFRTVSLSIIRSLSLYTQQWYMSDRFADSLRAGSGWDFSNLFLEWNSSCFGQFLCPSSGVFHCTHSKGIRHTGLLKACEKDQDGISQIYYWNKTLHVSKSSSVHHQEFFTVITAMVYVIQVCWQLASLIRMFHPDPACKLSANLYDIYHCCVYSEKLLMIDRGTVRNV
jgi:hypothetical protein